MKLDLEGRSFLLFGGKGGNGKTTSACATAMHLARERPEQRILIVSTDPAHSIGDSFQCPVGSSITPIDGVENLWGLEIAAGEEFERFKERYVDVMKKIFDRGTFFDRQDIDGIFEMTPPGMEEMMAILRIAKLLRDGEFDAIIIDTAPTGHTMKLLNTPDELGRWVTLFSLMQSKHRFLSKQFTGRYRRDDADEFLRMMRNDLKRVLKLLKGLRTTLFIPVVIPEDLPVTETEKLLSFVNKRKIPTRHVIVNRVKSSRGNCPYCSPETEDQKKWMVQIYDKFSNYDLCEVPTFPYDIHGLERLSEYGDYLFPAHKISEGTLSPNIFWNGHSDAIDRDLTRRKNGKPSSEGLELEISETGSSFVIFGGKGGVGKTSLAAATALNLVSEYPTKKVLVFSTDPAHSLGESFDTPIGESVVQIVPGLNLFGIEINAEKLLAEFNEAYTESAASLFKELSNEDVVFDREIMEGLVSKYPPGLDEIMALSKVMEFVDEDRFDIYVFDTAATGHLLNFLATPTAIRKWLKMTFRLQLKYKEIMDLTLLAENLLDLSKKVRQVQSILTDSERCQFIAVTIPEVMGIRELDRLLDGIRELEIPSSNIVVNMVRSDTDCHFCQFKGDLEHELIERLVGEKEPDYQVSQVPLFNDPVKGIENLNKLGEVLYAQREKEYA